MLIKFISERNIKTQKHGYLSASLKINAFPWKTGYLDSFDQECEKRDNATINGRYMKMYYTILTKWIQI